MIFGFIALSIINVDYKIASYFEAEVNTLFPVQVGSVQLGAGSGLSVWGQRVTRLQAQDPLFRASAWLNGVVN